MKNGKAARSSQSDCTGKTISRHIPIRGQRPPRPARWHWPALLCCAVIAPALLAGTCHAQLQRQAGFEPSVFAVTEATVVPEPGQRIEGGTVLLKDGLIVEVGREVAVPADAEVIDGKGLFVYAGFIDAAGTDLLDPESKPVPQDGRKVDFSRYALAATRPDNRNRLTPEYRAADALKLDSKTLESIRQSGFTAVQVVPSGRVASGQAALVDTSGAPPRESVMAESTFTAFRLFAPRGGRYPSTLMGATAHLRQAFLDAGRYRRHRELFENGTKNIERPPIDPALAALGRVLMLDDRALFLADSRDDIHRALDFAAEFDVPVTLWGGREAWRAVERLKREEAAVVLSVDFGTRPEMERQKPSEELKPEIKPPLRVQRDRLGRWKERVAGLGRLHQAGIRFALTSRRLKNRGEILDNLRLAVEEGLPRDAALAALTSDAAAVLGVDDRLGTLEPGKLAHVVIMTGPFDHEKSKVRYVFVGRAKSEYNTDAEPVAVTNAGEKNESEPDEDGSEPADAGLTGTWRMRIKSASGKLTADLQLVQKGERLSGTFASPQGEGKVASGRVEKETVEFVVEIDAGKGTIDLKFSGRISGDKLSGELRSAFGATTNWSATRSNGSSRQADPSVPIVRHPVEAPVPDSRPTELESDRLDRPIETGGNVLIKNATVLTCADEEKAGFSERQERPNSVLVTDGKIAAVGRDLKAPEGVAVIDAAGWYVMPGIIDTHSHIMITGGVNESTQSIVPEVRIKDVVDTDDASEYRALAGGVTTARLPPITLADPCSSRAVVTPPASARYTDDAAAARVGQRDRRARCRGEASVRPDGGRARPARRSAGGEVCPGRERQVPHYAVSEHAAGRGGHAEPGLYGSDRLSPPLERIPGQRRQPGYRQ